jgi:hypothetical protein
MEGGKMMRRFVMLVGTLLVVAAVLSPLHAAAQPLARVNGGGTATGPDTSSQFGMGIAVRADGSVSGDFNCVMAGRSAMPGLSLMAVRGQPTSATITSGSATFSGVGTLIMKNAQGGAPEVMTGMDFTVAVTPGGAGVGTLSLSVPAASFSMSEVVSSGQIRIH